MIEKLKELLEILAFSLAAGVALSLLIAPPMILFAILIYLTT